MLNWDILEPGDCVTVFTPNDQNTNFTQSLGVKWRWQIKGGFDPNLKKVISDSEIKEAFLTCLDIADKLFPSYPQGIRLHDDDRQFLERNSLSIGGGSLGLAFLYGLFCHVKQLRPSKTIAWGAIHPTRNNCFAIYPTDAAAKKMEIAAALGADYVLHPEAEPETPKSGIKEIRIKAPVWESVVQLNTDSLYLQEK